MEPVNIFSSIIFKIHIISSSIRCVDTVYCKKTVNILRLEMITLSRKPARSNFTNPYSIRVYKFKAPILRESHTLIYLLLKCVLST